MKKRWLAILLTVAMCLSLLPFTAAAEQNKLFMRFAMTDSNGKFTVSTRAPMDTYSLPFGYNATVIFYYGTEDNAQMVHMDDLALENLSLAPRPVERLASADLYGYVIRLYAGEVGNGIVTHKSTGATFTVNTTPDIELYATTSFEGEALNSLQFEENDTELTGVLKATTGWTILGTEATSLLPPPNFVTITPVTDQEYATISVDMTHADFLPGSYAFILLTQGTPYGCETSITQRVTYELTVEERYIEPALYSQPVLDEQYLLDYEITYTGQALEFYVLWDNLDINSIDPGDADVVEELYDGDELVGWHLKLENPTAGEYYLDVFGRSGDEWYLEFCIVDNRPQFRCRALTYNGQDYTLNENDMLRLLVSGEANQTVGYVFYEITGNQETELKLDDLTFPSHVTAAALNQEETWIALTFSQGNGKITYTKDGVELSLPTVVSDSNTGNWGNLPAQTFEYNGETCQIGLVSGNFIYDDVPRLDLISGNTHTGVSLDEITENLYSMAVLGTDNRLISDLTAGIQITDVSITKFYDLGGSCGVAVAEEPLWFEDTPLQTIALTMQDAFIAEISVSYELFVATPNGPIELSGVTGFRYRSLPQGVYNLDLSAADTAQKLNALMSSPEALISWMKDNAPDDYKVYKFLESMGDMGMSHFNLYLPAVTYDDVIVVQLEDTMMNIYGATDEDGNLKTVMPGLHLKNKSAACNLINIHFKHNSETELLYDGLSCAVLAYGDEDHYGDGNCIENCVIEGFGCALRNTQYGHIGLGTNNLIRDCTYGMYMDCAGKTRGSIYTDITRSTFASCDYGIYIKSLPDYIDSFEYRVYHCDFIDVDTDFTVLEKGNFYFYRNFYGTLKSGMTLETAKNATDILSRVPVVATLESTDTNVITNPRYVLSYVWLRFTDDNFLSIDSSRDTIILNKDANKLVMDTDELAKEADASDTAMVIEVADDNEIVQATWTIN